MIMIIWLEHIRTIISLSAGEQIGVSTSDYQYYPIMMIFAHDPQFSEIVILVEYTESQIYPSFGQTQRISL
jgi:hypothetical protein